MAAFKDPLTLNIGYRSKTNLLKQDEKLGRFTSAV